MIRAFMYIVNDDVFRSAFLFRVANDCGVAYRSIASQDQGIVILRKKIFAGRAIFMIFIQVGVKVSIYARVRVKVVR